MQCEHNAKTWPEVRTLWCCQPPQKTPRTFLSLSLSSLMILLCGHFDLDCVVNVNCIFTQNCAIPAANQEPLSRAGGGATEIFHFIFSYMVQSLLNDLLLCFCIFKIIVMSCFGAAGLCKVYRVQPVFHLPCTSLPPAGIFRSFLSQRGASCHY